MLYAISVYMISKIIFSLTEVLSSDEDDLEEMNNEYLENLARMAVKNSAQQGVNLTAKIEDYDESDDVSQLVSMLLLCFYNVWAPRNLYILC